MHTFGSSHDLFGSGARTIASLPKRDWCRIAFIVNEYNVSKISISTSYVQAHVFHFLVEYFY